MPSPQEFSARQAARLKARLIAYRALANRSGGLLSLMALIHEITDSDAAQGWLRKVADEPDDPRWLAGDTPLRQERADKGAPMTTNVLQKWFAGELVTRGRGAARMRVRHFTTPSPSNLMAIYAFLQEKGFITEGDLKEDPWPHAVLAASYRDYLAASHKSAGADGTPGALGEFFSATLAGREIIIRRLSITERGLGQAVAAQERIMVFDRNTLAAGSSATTIDLYRPRAVAVLEGWGYVYGEQVSLFTSGTIESAPTSHEYKALKCEQDKDGSLVLEMASIASRSGEAAQLTQEIVTNNPSAFVEQTLAALKAQGTRVQGPKIKLLRPAHLPDTDAEIYALLSRCFSYSPPYRFDWERFGLLASIIPNINARNPLSGGTILHLAARTLNRPAIKALIKRRDLDMLVLDDEGYLPSQRALEADSRSPIGHLLLRREIAAARTSGLGYAREIARLPITPEASTD